MVDKYGNTLLHRAASYNWECSGVMLAKYIDTTLENNSGKTALELSYDFQRHYSNYSEQLMSVLKGEKIEQSSLNTCDK